MRVTVCEFPNEKRYKVAAWQKLAEHCIAEQSEIVVLPEMPFCDWKMFMSRAVDQSRWEEATSIHDTMIARMDELEARMVLSSRPIDIDGQRFNQAFCWTPDEGYRGTHCKYYLPDEPDGWEATWFHRGDTDFTTMEVDGLKIGYQICTELLFSDVSRDIGRSGAHLIAAPRATSGHRRWRMAACMAAVMAGCFAASANRRSYDGEEFAGGSWLVSPEGEVLAETSAAEPFKTLDVDFSQANAAKGTYPRNLYVA